MEELQSFDVNTGEQQLSEEELLTEKTPKKKKKLVIGIIVAAVIIAIAAVVIFLFPNAKGKIPRAVIKTFGDIEKQNKLIGAFDVSDLVADKKYTVLLDVNTALNDYGDISVTSSLAVNKDVVEASGDIDISYIPTIEYCVQLDENELRASCPMLPDKQFTYCYTRKNKGYFDEFISTDYISDGIKEVYSAVFDEKDVFSISENVAKFVEEYEKINFDQVSDSKYTVNGKEVNCTGFKATLNKRLVRQMFSSFLLGLSTTTEALSDGGMDEFDDILSDITGMDMTIYLYDDEVAAIMVEPDGTDDVYEICFEGGDYRLQNMAFYANGKLTMRLGGSIEDDVETASISFGEDTAVEYKYNYNEGDLEVAFGDETYTAKLLRDERKFSFELDYIDFEDSFLGLSLAITPGAKLTDMSGEEIDLGNASEEEITQIIDEIESTVQGLLGQ